MATSTIAKLVKRFDYDRYLTTIFALDNYREDLLILYAFNIELSRISEVTSDATTALFRLQWWRDSIEDIYNNKTRDHFITKPLYKIIHDYNLPKHLFLELIEAREFDNFKNLHQDISQLSIYAKHTSSNLVELSLKILGNIDSFVSDIAIKGGIATGIIGNIRNAKYIQVINKPIVFPKTLLDKYQVTIENIIHGKNLSATANISVELIEICENLIDFDIAKIDKKIRSVFLSIILTKHIIKNIKKNEFNIFTTNIEYNKLSMLIKLYINML